MTDTADPNADLIGYTFRNSAGRTMIVTGSMPGLPSYVNLDLLDDDGDKMGEGAQVAEYVRAGKKREEERCTG